MFITSPFGPCPECGQVEFGTLSIRNNFHHRRCRNCRYESREQLPPVQKRLVYLDQMLLSYVAKELDPVWREKTRRPDPFWLKVFDQLDRLVKLQLIVCPESPIHEEESAYDDRFEGVLRRLYQHLASGVSLNFPLQIHIHQIWKAVFAMEEGRQLSWDGLQPNDIVHGELDRWSERLLMTVNTGHWDPVAVRRASRDNRHAAFVAVWDQWRTERGLSFDVQFERERRALSEVAVHEYRNHVARFFRDDLSAEMLADPMALMPGQLTMLVFQLRQRLATDGATFEEAMRRVEDALLSEGVLRVPKNHITTLLYAGLARRAVNGKKNPPSRGTPNDVDGISAYLPYCDAMFIDDEFAQLLGEGPIRTEIAGYPTRIFSTRTRDGFLLYLRQLEAEAPTDHLATVARIYGEGWTTPYRTLLEHERGRELGKRGEAPPDEAPAS